jgi:hypothetical protein
LYQWFDRFCFKHERKGIKNLMTIIAVGGLAVFVMDMFMASEERFFATKFLIFYKDYIQAGQYWRLITFVFVPMSESVLTLLALYLYHWFGKILEAEWGRLKLNLYYASGIVFIWIYGFLTGAVVSAAQFNLSLLLAVATVVPDFQIRLFFILPVKLKWLGLVSAVLLVISAVGGRSLLPLIPIGNYLLYFGPALKKMVFRPYHKKRVEFRSEVRRLDHEAAQRGYRHQCAVCGLTDGDEPGAEFRYCSKCSGSKCYCAKHIGDHEHV